MELGLPELLIVFAIIILIFGVGRISKIGSELGQGIQAFRSGLQGDNDPPTSKQKESPASENESPPAEKAERMH
jgi:sec-independent protein translocase protein TatA